MRRALPWLLVACLAWSCGDDDEAEEGVLADGEAATETDASSDSDPGPTPEDPGGPPPADPGTPADPGPPEPDDGPDAFVPPDPAAKAAVLATSAATGPTAGGTETVITCVGYTADFRDVTPEVQFDGSPASAVEALSRGIIKVTTPAGALGPANIVVSAAGESGTLADGFTYLDAFPSAHVKLTLPGAIEPGGVQVQLPLEVEMVGGAAPAALLIDVKIDALQLPLAAPTPVGGTVAADSNKTLDIQMKTDGFRILLIGKNRDPIKSGTITKLFYIVPPAEPYTLTPLTVTAQAVDGLGLPIEVFAESGWMAVEEDDE